MGGKAGVIEDDDIIKKPLPYFGLLQKTKCLTVTLEKRLEVNTIINVVSVRQSAERKGPDPQVVYSRRLNAGALTAALLIDELRGVRVACFR